MVVLVVGMTFRLTGHGHLHPDLQRNDSNSNNRLSSWALVAVLWVIEIRRGNYVRNCLRGVRRRRRRFSLSLALSHSSSRRKACLTVNFAYSHMLEIDTLRRWKLNRQLEEDRARLRDLESTDSCICRDGIQKVAKRRKTISVPLLQQQHEGDLA